MSKIISSRLFWGLILVIGGGLLLLDTFGVFKGNALFWTIVSAIAGVLFLSVFSTRREHWWALIPGIILLSVAVTIGFDSFLPGFSTSRYGGSIILGGIALSFLLVYLVERINWWAIIPAGIMATLAVVAGLDTGANTVSSGGIFFLGLGLTFVLVAILPNKVGQMRWAWIPAIILCVFGILILMAVTAYINYVWPAILLLVGILLIIRSIIRK